MAETVEV